MDTFPHNFFFSKELAMFLKKQEICDKFFISPLDVQILQSFTRRKKSDLNLLYWAEPFHDEWLLAYEAPYSYVKNKYNKQAMYANQYLYSTSNDEKIFEKLWP